MPNGGDDDDDDDNANDDDDDEWLTNFCIPDFLFQFL